MVAFPFSDISSVYIEVLIAFQSYERTGLRHLKVSKTQTDNITKQPTFLEGKWSISMFITQQKSFPFPLQHINILKPLVENNYNMIHHLCLYCTKQNGSVLFTTRASLPLRFFTDKDFWRLHPCRHYCHMSVQ